MTLLERTRPDLAAKYPRPVQTPAKPVIDERPIWVRRAEARLLPVKELAS
jgi:hypothetical protein